MGSNEKSSKKYCSINVESGKEFLVQKEREREKKQIINEVLYLASSKKAIHYHFINQ